MAKFNLKKKSKRQPARLRYRIEKKVKDHNRKVKKEEKKKGPKSKRNKVINIPNICPFKEDILKEVEIVKKHKEEERQKRRELAKQQKLAKKSTELTTLVTNAEPQDTIHESLTPALRKENSLKNGKKENSLKTCYKEVIEAADVVLEIVDARDPLGTRCIQVEEAVFNAKKKLVVVLNKADLVPRTNLEKWLKYLRGHVPAVPFKAFTQNQNSKLRRRKMTSSNDKTVKGVTGVGTELLMSVLGNYTRNKTIKTSINVGVVGLPNVGKSSLINSLKSALACNVGSTDAVTKAMQEVLIDPKIKLLDSPGIVFAKNTEPDDKVTVLKNVTNVAALKDPFTVASAILDVIDNEILCKIYDVVNFSTPQEFFSLKAQRSGRFKKKGVPDQCNAAKDLIKDWNGKIKFYTEPPETEFNLGEVNEFDFNALKSEEAAVLNQFDQNNLDNSILLKSSGPVNARDAEEEQVDKDGLLSDKKKSKHPSENTRKRKINSVLEVLEGNEKLNKNIEDNDKKTKKKQNEKVEDTSPVSDDYDFNQL